MKTYILSIDSGTTSCRTILFNQEGKIVAQNQIEFTQYFPQSGWVEQDALEIWNTQLTTLQNVKNKAKISLEEIEAVGITNQRETIVAWDSHTGLPICRAIVWQDRRTHEFCHTLIKEGKSDFFKDKTGLIINPYFSATKIHWLLNNNEEVKQKLKENRLLIGTVDSWLLWKLTEGNVFATDVSNASRTMLFNINTLEWDDEILSLLGIPKTILPEVKLTTDDYGFVAPQLFDIESKERVQISAVAGDQQASLFGSLCLDEGMVKNTYGTGCFALVNTGNIPVDSKHQLLTTIAWKLKGEEVVYALEGSVFIAGAAIQWLRDGLKVIYDCSECDLMISSIQEEDDQNIYFVPSFTGLGAPYWDSYSRGAIFGIERGTKRKHIVKACLNSIAYQTNDLISAMAKDLNKKISLLRVDGGTSNSDYLIQFQACVSRLDIQKLASPETSCLGIAYLAGLSSGFWKSVEELKNIKKISKCYKPIISEEKAEKLINGWNKAVERTLNWKRDIE